MKLKKIERKLLLSKSTVANLDNGDLKVVRGGICTINSLPQSGCYSQAMSLCC
jgi:hypothetical protein